jgi:hypothetical protein
MSQHSEGIPAPDLGAIAILLSYIAFEVALT